MRGNVAKVSETKFTIQFSKSDPAHLRVVEILNQKERGGKAQYIVDAVMYYENAREAQAAQDLRSVRLDEKHIEAVVERILRDKQASGGDDSSALTAISAATASHAAVSYEQDGTPSVYQAQHTDEIDMDSAMGALGEEGVNAVASALDMFRRK